MFQFLDKFGLISRIIFAMIVGIIVGLYMPSWANYVSILGDVFVKSLMAVAPILVFVLVISSIANFKISTGNASSSHKIRPIIIMYVVGMLLAALLAVGLSLAFPSTLILDVPVDTSRQAPDNVASVLKNVFLGFFMNPITALAEAKFLGILVWAIVLGFGFRHANDTTKQLLADTAGAVNYVIQLVIKLAPLGIFGIVTATVAAGGGEALIKYAHLLVVLVAAMAIVALVVNPLMVAVVTRSNPYPLVLKCLGESGLTAFFTRSSASNIPVNLALAKRLGIDDALAGVSIPLGATINMAGAAVTITVLTLAAVHTIGIEVDLSTMIILSIVATVSACGASGVAGGSLLLIPIACGLFGIEPNIAMQVVAVGMLIGVIQDSAETALNSSTDVLFTAAVDRSPLFNKN